MYLETTYKGLVICCISITFIFSICFLFLKVPKKESLRIYRISRKVMAFAYFVVGALNIIELHHIYDNPDIYFTSLVTLTVGAYQAILFTFTLLVLIDINVESKWKVLRELIFVSIFTTATYVTYFTDFDHLFKPIYYTFSIYFLSLIIRFSLVFFRHYRFYVHKINNYFSVQVANQLQWVRNAYFAIMTAGCLALISLYLGDTFAYIFNIYYVTFYIYFGIHFINYVYIFDEIETAIVLSDKKDIKFEKCPSFSFDQLDQAINDWEQKGSYTEPGITIEQVAGEIKTNRTYLSNYVNTYKKMTFNEWINHLRIEEAKKLLIYNPQLPVSQIGAMIGLPDKSNFGRQFAKRTGISPLAWRKINKT